MTDIKYKIMLRRRRFIKRVLLFFAVLITSFYVSVALFGNLKTPRVINLTSLGRCPACYGVSVCPELYSDQIVLDDIGWTNMFNAKNIFFGYLKSNRRVVLKKLAHDWELREFDEKLCDVWGPKSECQPVDIDSKVMDEKLLHIVQYNLSSHDLEPRKGLVMCPYAYSLHEFLEPVVNKKTSQNYDMAYVWTMLTINPEPIVLQVIPKSRGWPVPAYGGVCGRLELLAYEGEPLSSLMHVEWHRKLKFAKGILDAAMDFTFRHDRFRFYLMDWSLDNLVANEKDGITFVDLEDVIVLDKHISPNNDLPNWYKRYHREDLAALGDPGFTFSIDKICRHHLSDHNIWAACYVLSGPENPLLHPIPKDIKDSRPHLEVLLKECLRGDDRFRTVVNLQHVINDLLLDERVVGYGAVNR